MKPAVLTSLATIVALSLLTIASPARAQSNPQQAADMLRALNIQIGQAQTAGNKARVLTLQDRYNQIQKKWKVQPSPAPAVNPPKPPSPPPVDPSLVNPPKPPPVPTPVDSGFVDRTVAPPANLLPVSYPESTPEHRMLTLFQEKRTSRKAIAVTIDPKLNAAAKAHCMDMAERNFFDHESPVTKHETFRNRAYQAGTTALNEVISKEPDPLKAVMGWSQDPILVMYGHRIGVGRAERGGVVYWTLLIGD